MNRALPGTVLLVLAVLSAPAAPADYEAGLAAYESGHYDTALEAWQPLAEQGDGGAQWGLGMLYANGFGVEMNDEQALHWFGLAAAQGHAKAQYRLGVMHQNGWGVPMDDDAAAEWFAKAAEQGHTQAQIALAQILAADYSPLYDMVEAYKWFTVAAELGDADAVSKRDDLAARMDPADLDQAQALVAEWIQGHEALLAEGRP